MRLIESSTHTSGMAKFLMVAIALVAPCTAFNLLGRFEPLGRPLLERFLADTLPSAPLTWATEGPGARLQLTFWRWLSEASGGRYSVLALPVLEEREVRQLMELQEVLPSDSYRIELLPEGTPVPGIAATALQPPPSPPALADDSSRVAMERTGAWVERTLTPSGLQFCPYTASARVAGSGLEGYGVEPAPIMYAHCASSSLPELLATFWSSCAAMVEGGEARTSSILLSAPHWDERWDEWCHVVFPLLEEAVLAAGLGRELGIVCFHPEYVTPNEEWLARHRFGHVHSTARLRSYLEIHDLDLAASSSDDEILWAGSYQRRSPHATINVLWARQLEQAEQKRKSSLLYTRNMRKALGEGRTALESQSREERRCPFDHDA